MHQAIKFKKGDLVTFDPKHSDEPWVDKVALVLDINDDVLTLLCEGDILEEVEWWGVILLSEVDSEYIRTT